MNKITLSDSLKGQSICYLKEYISKERKRPLTNNIKRKIKKLMETKAKKLDKFSIDIIKSPLFTLAVAEIVRGGYNKYICVDGKQKYDIHPAEIMLMMLDIVDVANRQGQKTKLEDYCRRCK